MSEAVALEVATALLLLENALAGLARLSGETRETGKRIFEQQERRCDFERDRLAHVFAVRSEPRGDLGDFPGERGEICVAQSAGVILEPGCTVAECEQRRRIA